MAQDKAIDARNVVYRSGVDASSADGSRMADMQADLGSQRTSAGGGGLPWFGRPDAAYRNPAPVAPYKPAVGEERPNVGNPDGAEKMFAGMDMATLIQLLLAGGSTIGSMASNRGGNQGISSQTSDPAIQAMLQAQMGRMTKSEPLYDAILKMAGGLMPTQYQPASGVSAPPVSGTPGNPFRG
jgi:hypothetical protein